MLDDFDLQQICYSDPVEEMLDTKDLDDDDLYDDQSFGSLLESSNDF